MIPLFRAGTGELLALIEADYLGQMRTGAATGVATKLLARKDANTFGIIGTGMQAKTQLEAVVALRKIDCVYAFGRDASRRDKFAQEMTAKLGVPVKPAASAEEAVRQSDILITATTAKEPVLKGAWLRSGMHINAIGANFPEKRELDSEAIARADAIFVDSCEQSKMEAGDLIQAFRENSARWNEVRELSTLFKPGAVGRSSPDEITIFKSNGIAIQDVVTAGKVYELALERNLGKPVEFWKDEGARAAH